MRKDSISPPFFSFWFTLTSLFPLTAIMSFDLHLQWPCDSNNGAASLGSFWLKGGHPDDPKHGFDSLTSEIPQKWKCIIPKVWAPTHQAHCKVVKSKSYREVAGEGGKRISSSPSSKVVVMVTIWDVSPGSLWCACWNCAWALEQGQHRLGSGLSHLLTSRLIWGLQNGDCQSWHWGTWTHSWGLPTSFCQALIDPSSSPMMLPSTAPVRVPWGSGQGHGGRDMPGSLQRSGPGIFG